MKTRVIFDKQMADERGWKPEAGTDMVWCPPENRWELFFGIDWRDNTFYSRMVESSPVLTEEDFMNAREAERSLNHGPVQWDCVLHHLNTLLAQRQTAPQGRRLTGEILKDAWFNNAHAGTWDGIAEYLNALTSHPESEIKGSPLGTATFDLKSGEIVEPQSEAVQVTDVAPSTHPNRGVRFLCDSWENSKQDFAKGWQVWHKLYPKNGNEDMAAHFWLSGITHHEKHQPKKVASVPSAQEGAEPPKASEEWEYAWGFAAIEAGWDYNDCTVVTIEPAGIGELKFHARVTGFTDKDIYRRPKPAQPTIMEAMEPITAQPSPVTESAPVDGGKGFRQWVKRRGEYIELWIRSSGGTHLRKTVKINSGEGDVLVELEKHLEPEKPVATVEQETETLEDEMRRLTKDWPEVTEPMMQGLRDAADDLAKDESFQENIRLEVENNTLREQLAEAMSAKEDAINRQAEQMARADGLRKERDELKQKVGEEKAINRFLTATNYKLTERSVGAMAIAAKEEGWENVPLDCPMLATVEQLSRHCDDLKKDIGQVDAALGNVAAFDGRKDRPAKIRKAMLTAAQVEKLTAEHARLTRELELKERARVIAVASLFSCAEELDALKASLAWVPVTPETMPKESDADCNGNVEWKFFDGSGMDNSWRLQVSGRVAWRPTNLPEPKQEAEDGFEVWMKKENPTVTNDSDEWHLMERGYEGAKSEGGKA